MVHTRGGSYALPEPFRQFMQDVDWPQNVRYEWEEGGEKVVWMLQLGLWCEMTAEECAYHHPLFGVGHYDGGNYILVLDMSDPDPTDPRVYAHDHDAYDTFDPTQDFGIRLSEFLSRLEPEG